MPVPMLKSLASKAGKPLKDAERYWQEASSCEKLPGDRKYRCKTAVVKKRLGLESFNPEYAYCLVEGWYDKSGGMAPNGQWFGAVSKGDGPKYAVVLEGMAAMSAAVNASSSVQICGCTVLPAEFTDVFTFMPEESKDDEKKYVTEDKKTLVVAGDGSIKFGEKAAPFTVGFPQTGTLAFEDETKILNWWHDLHENLQEETTTSGAVVDAAGAAAAGAADKKTGEDKTFTVGEVKKKGQEAIKKGEEVEESYNDNYNKSVSFQNQRKEQADGSTPARNEELLHVPSGKIGIVEHRDDKFISIKSGRELIVDRCQEFNSISESSPMMSLIEELQRRHFVTEQVSESCIAVSKGMCRCGQINVVGNKMIYEMTGLEPRIFFLQPEKLVTIIDGIFGKKSS